MYSNNILNFQESATILNGHTKKVWKLIVNRSDMYKKDLALNNPQWLICHKPNQTKPNHIYLIYMYKKDMALKYLQ